MSVINAKVVSDVILSVLTAVQALLPLLGVSGNAAAAVAAIIGMLTKVVRALERLAPLVGDEVSLIYQGVKSIIASLRSDSVSTTAEQDADLDALDARVDAAWDRIAPQFDPDAGVA